MKLKEKLARDYYQERPQGFGEPTQDYLAGFEKAREMAVELIAIRSNESDQLCPEIKNIGEETIRDHV